MQESIFRDLILKEYSTALRALAWGRVFAVYDLAAHVQDIPITALLMVHYNVGLCVYVNTQLVCIAHVW